MIAPLSPREIGGRRVFVPSFDERGFPEVRDRYWKILGWVARSRGDGLDFVDRYLRAWFRRQGLTPGKVELLCRDPSVSRLEIDAALVDAVRSRAWTFCGTWDPATRGTRP